MTEKTENSKILMFRDARKAATQFQPGLAGSQQLSLHLNKGLNSQQSTRPLPGL